MPLLAHLRHPAPPLWRVLGEFLTLSKEQERRWWHALCAAQWSTTVG